MPSPSKQQGVTQYLPLIPSAGSTAHHLCITKGWQQDVWHSVCCALQDPVYYYSHCYWGDSLSGISSTTVCRYPKPQAYMWTGMSLKLGLFPSGSSRRVGSFHGVWQASIWAAWIFWVMSFRVLPIERWPVSSHPGPRNKSMEEMWESGRA